MRECGWSAFMHLYSVCLAPHYTIVVRPLQGPQAYMGWSFRETEGSGSFWRCTNCLNFLRKRWTQQWNWDWVSASRFVAIPLWCCSTRYTRLWCAICRASTMLLTVRVLSSLLRTFRFTCMRCGLFEVISYKLKPSKPVPSMPNILLILFDVESLMCFHA